MRYELQRVRYKQTTGITRTSLQNHKQANGAHPTVLLQTSYSLYFFGLSAWLFACLSQNTNRFRVRIFFSRYLITPATRTRTHLFHLFYHNEEETIIRLVPPPPPPPLPSPPTPHYLGVTPLHSKHRINTTSPPPPLHDVDQKHPVGRQACPSLTPPPLPKQPHNTHATHLKHG